MMSTALIIRNKCLLQQISTRTHLRGKGVIWKEQLRNTQLLAFVNVLYTPTKTYGGLDQTSECSFLVGRLFVSVSLWQDLGIFISKKLLLPLDGAPHFRVT